MITAFVYSFVIDSLIREWLMEIHDCSFNITANPFPLLISLYFIFHKISWHPSFFLFLKSWNIGVLTTSVAKCFYSGLDLSLHMPTISIMWKTPPSELCSLSIGFIILSYASLSLLTL